MRVGVLDVWSPRIRELVGDAAPTGFDLRFAESYELTEQAAIAAGSDLLLTGWAPISGEMIRNAPHLRMIQKWGVGIDRIDLEAARQQGVVVAIAAGSNASAVAEHVVMLMLAVYRHLSLVDRALRDGRWLFADMRERCLQLRDKQIGIIGLGHIGQMVARKLRGFDVEVVYTDPVRLSPAVEEQLGVTFRSWGDLLATSALVTLHLPGGPANRRIMDAEAFSRMRPGGVLINTARGDLVDEEALCDALASGQLLGAGLDTFETEPLRPDSRLLTFDQVVVTPHTAGSVVDNVGHVADHVFRNMRAVLEGQPLPDADVIVPPG
jgi:phosphoglycerate dehydrogenase-like enzyme